MTKDHSHNLIRGIFNKENLDYLLAEIGGTVLSYAAAFAVVALLKNTDVVVELNVILTFIALHSGFWLGNIVTHRIAYKLQHKGHYPEHFFRLLFKANFTAFIITGILQLIAHYVLLRTGVVSYYMAPLIGYTVPALAGTIYRQIMNYENGIFSFKKK